jgi:hypothetical protein
MGTASIYQHSIELDVLYNGANNQRVPPRHWNKVWVVTAIEDDGYLKPSKVLGCGGLDHQDLLGYELLLPLGLIWVGVTKNIVDLLVCLWEIAIGILKLLLMIGQFGRLENLICKTLESVAVSGLVLSLGWKMQMWSRKPSNSPGLGQYSLWWQGHSTTLIEQSDFLFLSWPLDELGWSGWPDSFLCSLLSRVTSSARVYLLAMENIYFDVLGFFMASFWIWEESLSPFLKNIMINLSSTSGMTFLLLQKHWMYSRRDSPFFWTTLARSQSTPGRAVRKLLVNNRRKWLQDRTDPTGNSRSQVLADDDK